MPANRQSDSLEPESSQSAFKPNRPARLNKPAQPLPPPRRLRLFGRRLPEAMLLGTLMLVGLIVLIVVFAIAG
ncbi:MAG: hypothetical protein OXE04_00405 [bacterium]|nr:hypothetical protein [bacterium]